MGDRTTMSNLFKCVNISRNLVIILAIIIVLNILLRLPTIAAQEDYIPQSVLRWLPVSSNISVPDVVRKSIDIYSPTFEWIDRFPILQDPEFAADIIFDYEWSPDESRLAVLIFVLTERGSGDTALQIWDVATKQRLVEHFGITGDYLAWSPDSQYVATNYVIGGYSTALLFHADDGSLYTQFHDPGPDLIWHPNEPQVAVLGNTVQLWDVGNLPQPPQLIIEFGLPYANQGFAYSSMGNDIAFVQQPDTKSIVIYNIPTSQFVQTLRGHQGNVTDIRWGDFPLTTVGLDNTLRVWNTTSGQATLVIPGDFPSAPEWSPDAAKMLIYSEELGIHIRSGTTGEVLATLN